MFTLVITKNALSKAFRESEKRRDVVYSSFLTPPAGATVEMEAFGEMLACQSLLDLERAILLAELYEKNTGKPSSGDKNYLKRTRQSYIDLRKRCEKKLGKAFSKTYAAVKHTQNNCERTNLDNSDGSMYCVVLPEFDKQGKHKKLGPKDFPWKHYKKSV